MPRTIPYVVALACYMVGPPAHAAKVAVVDFQTGGVTFLGANEGPHPNWWIGIAIYSTDGLLLAENAEDFGDITDALPHSNGQSRAIAWSKFGGINDASIYAGNIVDVSGLHPRSGPAFLKGDLSCLFHPAFGVLPTPAEIRIVNVPEPAAATMIFAAMTGVLALRGRRGRK